MKILIIGSGGQLGSDCTTVLSPHHEVRGCDFPEIDITSRDSVASLIENNQPEVIINCAAYTAVDKCETETDLAWKVNADGPEYLAQATSAIGARLVHISTDYVFDGNKDIPGSYLESDSPNPLSEYGRSKLAGEEAVNRYAQDYVILRTAWLYSATGPNFLKTMLRLAVSSPEKELKVVNDQYGSLTWSYPLAQQIEQLLDSRIQGIVHTTSENYSTWYEAARYFLDTMGVHYRMAPCTTEEYPTPAHRPANSILENGVLKENGMNLFKSWKSHVDDFVRNHKEQLLKEVANQK